MNHYSWLQQKLHQFALSTKFMRETAFDYESFFISPSQSINNHVFIAGLARSGTTILLNALYHSNEFASLSYKDMPFVLAPNLWSKWSNDKKIIHYVERAHKDGIEISIESPEAFEEVFWKTFDEKDIETEEKFKTYIQLINNRYQKRRYLSKNNQNIRRINVISKIFPNSKILIPFRDPMQHAYSLLVQHKKFIEYSKDDKFISNYMSWIGHTEFGPNYIPIINTNTNFKNPLSINHWVEQWYLTYKNCFDNFKDQKNIHFICYETLCKSEKCWPKILKKLDIPETYFFEFKHSTKQTSTNINNELNSDANSLYDQLIEVTLK